MRKLSFVKNPMKLAIDLASKSPMNEVPVGCVIVNNKNQLLSFASNEIEKKRDPTAHAEILAIRRASKFLNKNNFKDTRLYVTLEPCQMCKAAIYFSGIKKVFFGAYAIEGVKKYNRYNKKYHFEESSYQFFGGINEKECSNLLKLFFKKLRVKN